MNRRAFLSTTGLAAAGVALAACSQLKGASPQQIATVVVTDAQLVANGLASVLPAVSGIPANIEQTLSTAAKDAAQAAGDLTTTMTQNVAQPLVQRISGDVSLFAKDLAGFVNNPTVKSILTDIQVLMPIIVTAVGLFLPAGAKAASPLEVEAARARLAALPKKV